MKKLILILALLTTVLMSGVFASNSDAGSKSAVFIHLPSNARAAALKNAVTASSYGSEGVFYNPAMLSYGKSGVGLMHRSLFAGINNQVLTASLKLKEDISAIGVGVNYVDYGTIDAKEIAGASSVDLGRKAEAYGLAFNLVYSRRVNSDFSVGLNFKMIQEDIDNVSGTAFGGGAGLYYDASEKLKLGVMVDGLSTKIKYQSKSEKIPVKISGGLSYNLVRPVWVHADIAKLSDDKLHLNAGLEIFLTPHFALRGGATTLSSDDSKFSAGLGVSLENLSLNYAFIPQKALSTTHAFSLKFTFK